MQSAEGMDTFMKLTITKTGKLSKCTLAKGETTVILSHDVTVISTKAFDSCREKITKLVIGEGVMTIEAEACKGMTALTELMLPDTLTDIQSCAFEGCTALAEIRLPDSVKEIGTHAFADCENLEKLRLPDGLEKLSDCIGGCMKLKNIEIPASVKYIAPRAFSQVNMGEITLGQGVETIDAKVFFQNAQLKKVTLPSTVRLMAPQTFAGCTALEEFVFPAELRVADFQKKDSLCYFEGCTALQKVCMMRDQAKTYLKATAAQLKKDSMPYKADKDKFEIFKGCTALTEITFMAEDTARWSDGTCDFRTEADGEHLIKCLKTGILEYTVPEDITVIEDKAFSENTRLKTLTLGSKIKRLDLRQFAGCRLGSLSIPDTLTEIADNNFLSLRGTNQYGKTEWASIQIFPTHPTYGVQDGLLYTKKDGVPHTLLYNTQPVRWNALVIPEGIEILAPSCCDDSKQTEVQLPDSLRVIGTRAFANNRNLTKINLPEGVEEIGAEAFLGCRSLVELHIPDSVIRFGDGLIVPKKAVILCSKDSAADKYAQANKLDVRYVGQTAEDSNQEGGEAPQAEETLLFDWGTGKDRQIISNFLGGTDDVTLPIEKDGIAVKGYSENLLDRVRKTVKRVVVPEGIIEIPDRFFAHCESLEEVVLPSTLESIGNLAFNYCWSLHELKIPESVREISVNAFGDTLGQKYLIIYGVWGSAAHNRAREDGCRFVDIRADEETQQLQQKFLTRINEDGTLTILEFFRGTAQDCAIPEKIGGREVTGISRTFASGFNHYDEIRLPKTVRNIEGRNVGNTPRLIIDPENPHFKADDKMWYSQGGKVLQGVLRSARNENELSIPESVELITEGALDDCTALKRLYVPVGVRGMYMYDGTVREDYCRIRIENLSVVGQRGSYAEYMANENNMIFLPDGESEEIHALREKFCVRRIMAQKNPGRYPAGTQSALAVGGYRGDDSEVWIPEEIAGEKVCGIAGWKSDNLPQTVHIPSCVQVVEVSRLAQEAVYVSEDNPVFYCEDGKLYHRADKQLLSCPPHSDITKFWSEMEKITQDALNDLRTDELRLPEGVKEWEYNNLFPNKTDNRFNRVILPMTLKKTGCLYAKEVVLHVHQLELLAFCRNCERVTVLDKEQQTLFMLIGAPLSILYRCDEAFMQRVFEVSSMEKLTPEIVLKWYDKQFIGLSKPDEKLAYAAYRLHVPYALEEKTRTELVTYLKRVARKAAQSAIDQNDIPLMKTLMEQGIVTSKNAQPLIDLCSEKNMVEWTAVLLEGTRKL